MLTETEPEPFLMTSSGFGLSAIVHGPVIGVGDGLGLTDGDAVGLANGVGEASGLG
jgi:hypothetical protein